MEKSVRDALGSIPEVVDTLKCQSLVNPVERWLSWIILTAV